MTPQQCVGLGVRLFSIWLGLEGFRYSMQALQAMAAPSRPGIPGGMSALALAMGVLVFVVAVALWFFPMTVAHRIVPRTRFENRLDASALDLARVGCALLGLWVLVEQIPHLLRFFLAGLYVSGSQSVFDSMGSEARIYLMETAFQCSIGAILFFGSTRIALLSLGRREGKTVSADDGSKRES